MTEDASAGARVAPGTGTDRTAARGSGAPGRPQRVLIVSRELPPAVGPHPIRVAKLVKFLPEFGWQPTVLTVPIDHAWAVDNSLAADIEGVPVVRVPRLLSRIAPPTSSAAAGKMPETREGAAGSQDDARGDGEAETGVVRRSMPQWRGALGRQLLLPDYSVLWAIPAARRAGALRARFDAVLTTAPPFSTHFVGYFLATQYGMPWVAEYRDNWTMNPLYRRNRAAQFLNEQLERRWLAAAAAIDVVSEHAADEIDARFPGSRSRIVVAPNGFDPDDLPAHQPVPVEFELAYAGHLGSTRDPRPLYDAIQLLGARRPEVLAHFRLRLMGAMEPWVGSDAIARFGAAHVSVDGMLPHKEALLRASRAAVLLMITNTGEAGGAALTSKIFEYVGLQRPVLALAPPGPATALLSDLHAGRSAAPDDPPAIAAAVEQLFDDWLAGREQVATMDSLWAYTRRATAKRVAVALDMAATAWSGHRRR